MVPRTSPKLWGFHSFCLFSTSLLKDAYTPTISSYCSPNSLCFPDSLPQLKSLPLPGILSLPQPQDTEVYHLWRSNSTVQEVFIYHHKLKQSSSPLNSWSIPLISLSPKDLPRNGRGHLLWGKYSDFGLMVTMINIFEHSSYVRGFPGGSVVKNPPANEGDERDMGSIPGWGRSPREGNGSPFQNSCLENSMDRGDWRATVHGLVRSQTQYTHHMLSTY